MYFYRGLLDRTFEDQDLVATVPVDEAVWRAAVPECQVLSLLFFLLGVFAKSSLSFAKLC